MNGKSMLQLNAAGSWRNVCEIAPDQITAALPAIAVLASVLGERPTWRIIGAAGVSVHYNDKAIRAAAAFAPRPPQKSSPSELVVECRLAALQTGLNLHQMTGTELIAALEALYTKGFKAGAAAAGGAV